MNDALELSLHRALRAEVPPSGRWIFAQLAGSSLRLRVIHLSGEFDWRLFEEVVESDLEAVAPPDLPRPPPGLEVRTEQLAPETAFEEVRRKEGERLIHCNPWAEPLS